MTTTATTLQGQGTSTFANGINAIDPLHNTQALTTTYAARLRTFNTSLIAQVTQQNNSVLPPRSAKRGQTVVNYAEDDDDDFEDRGDATRNGARNGLETSDEDGRPTIEIKGKRAPDIQAKHQRTNEQYYQASLLPTTLVPVRIDLDINPTTRLKDSFLWNLYESLITPDQFARNMCLDLDIDTRFVSQISAAITAQIADYAPIASIALPDSLGGVDEDPSYRVIISLSLYLGKHLYQDKFEWDLLNEELTPEHFARVLCCDLGLTGEHYPLIVHAIYESILKAKKEVFETGGLQFLDPTNLENDAAYGSTFGAGWRHDPEGLGHSWGPSFEQLTKEDIEKREGDRERQIRRLRRETARFTTGAVALSSANFFFNDTTTPSTPSALGDEILGRGERKKRKRNRSISPSAGTPRNFTGKDAGATAGAGGSNGIGIGSQNATQLNDYEKHTWKCTHCKVPGSGTWSVRDGPDGARTLCNICGALWKKNDQILPEWRLDLFGEDD